MCLGWGGGGAAGGCRRLLLRTSAGRKADFILGTVGTKSTAVTCTKSGCQREREEEGEGVGEGRTKMGLRDGSCRGGVLGGGRVEGSDSRGP